MLKMLPKLPRIAKRKRKRLNDSVHEILIIVYDVSGQIEQAVRPKLF